MKTVEAMNILGQTMPQQGTFRHKPIRRLNDAYRGKTRTSGMASADSAAQSLYVH